MIDDEKRVGGASPLLGAPPPVFLASGPSRSGPKVHDASLVKKWRPEILAQFDSV
jgi:hypothetical protein